MAPFTCTRQSRQNAPHGDSLRITPRLSQDARHGPGDDRPPARRFSAPPTRPAASGRSSAPASSPTRSYHDWGELPAGHRVRQHARRVRRLAGPDLHPPHRARHQRAARHDGGLRRERQVRPKLGQAEFEGGAHGLHIQARRQGRVPLSLRHQARLVTKATPKGEIVWQFGYPKESPKYAGERRRHAGQSSNSPTNIAIAPNGDFYVADGYGSSYITQYEGREVHPHVRRQGQGGRPARLPARPDRRHARRDADPARRRSQQQAAPDVHARRRSTSASSTDFPAPCHFSERKGVMVVPDLFARVTLIDRRQQGDRAARRRRHRLVEADPQRPARRVPGREVRLPAQRDLRSRRQHLRRRMGRGGPGDEAAAR